jgi:EmrB/QacA subfamily drug resistance transporter
VTELELTPVLRPASRLASSAGWWRRFRSSDWRALPVLMAGTFMIVLDFFIVNVTVPSMQAELHAGPTAVEWAVAGYGLTFAVFLIGAGRLGDQIGRRRMFSLGLALFTLASVACAAAPNAAVLVVSRLAQGLSAALLSPSVLSIIGVVFTGGRRIRAISVYGMVMGLAAVGGQLIGGVLIQADVAGLGWRSVFVINVPIGLAALALAPRWVPESRAATLSRLDLVGTGLVTAALVAIVLPLIEGRRDGWPAWTWASLASVPLLAAVFVAQQRRLSRRGGSPLVDPGLFRSRSFSAGLVTQLALWAGQASFFLVLAVYLQEGRALSPLQAGGVFTILAAAYLAASLRAPALTVRFGRRLIAAGALTLASGHAALLAAVAASTPGGTIALLAPGLLLVGAGMGLCITPLTTTVLATVDREQAGAVSGVLSTMQQVGNALGVAVTGVIFFGALRHGVGYAFELSVGELAALLVGVGVLARLLPRQAHAQ